MEGFFSKKETESNFRPDGKTYSCASCGLYKDCQSPRMKPYGNGKKGIVNIGMLTISDDERGKPWQGKTGRFLRRIYEEQGIDLFEDCINIPAVFCYTDKPTNYNVACCRSKLMKYLAEIQPKMIFLYGMNAVDSVIGHRWKKDMSSIDKWRGWQIPDQELKSWLHPMLDPNFVGNATAEILTVFKNDFIKAVEKLEEPFPRFKKPNIKVIEDLSVLDSINTQQVAFDYETTGKKPHSAGHRIICCSVAYTENDVYVFMMPKTKKEREPFLRVLTNPKIGKIAQNMKFEHTWSRERLRVEVTPWDWDTMLATHIIDNRSGVTGLKFQMYVQFGVIDYSSEIEPYLRAKDEKDSNAINQIEELLKKPGGKEKLLTYCAMDSIGEFRLAQRQIKVFDYDFLPFY